MVRVDYCFNTRNLMDKIAIWDADFIPFYVCHNKKGEEEKSLDDCKLLVDMMIKNINNAVNANYFNLYLTVGKCFRYTIYPEYKANRKYGEVKHLFDTKQYLIDKYQAVSSTGLEADDLVCITKNKFSKLGYECVIVSPDKDILFLEGTHYNPKRNEWVKTDKEESELYFWKSMITGDTADNLPGIKGIGEVGANKLLDYKHINDWRSIVFNKYCEVYGEKYGIEMFYKMYNCLKMVDEYDFNLPTLIKHSEEVRLFE